jgi:hypothetical protein
MSYHIISYLTLTLTLTQQQQQLKQNFPLLRTAPITPRITFSPYYFHPKKQYRTHLCFTSLEPLISPPGLSRLRTAKRMLLGLFSPFRTAFSRTLGSRETRHELFLQNMHEHIVSMIGISIMFHIWVNSGRNSQKKANLSLKVARIARSGDGVARGGRRGRFGRENAAGGGLVREGAEQCWRRKASLCTGSVARDRGLIVIGRSILEAESRRPWARWKSAWPRRPDAAAAADRDPVGVECIYV